MTVFFTPSQGMYSFKKAQWKELLKCSSVMFICPTGPLRENKVPFYLCKIDFFRLACCLSTSIFLFLNFNFNFILFYLFYFFLFHLPLLFQLIRNRLGLPSSDRTIPKTLRRLKSVYPYHGTIRPRPGLRGRQLPFPTMEESQRSERLSIRPCQPIRHRDRR